MEREESRGAVAGRVLGAGESRTRSCVSVLFLTLVGVGECRCVCSQIVPDSTEHQIFFNCVILAYHNDFNFNSFA